MRSRNLKLVFYLGNLFILIGFALAVVVSSVAIHNMIPDHNKQTCQVVGYNEKNVYSVKPVDPWKCDSNLGRVRRVNAIKSVTCFEGSYRLYYGDTDREYFNTIPIYYNSNKTIVLEWLESHFPLGSSVVCSYAAACLSLHFEEPYWMLLGSYITFLTLLMGFIIINYCYMNQCKSLVC